MCDDKQTGHDMPPEHMFKEIDLIQGIIQRMSLNSFLLKGWTVTLVAAALLVKGDTPQGAVTGCIPLLVFWLLDAYFLRQERLRRKQYDWVVENRMNTSSHFLDMDTSRFEGQVASLTGVFFSWTLLWFYGAVLLLLAAEVAWLLS